MRITIFSTITGALQRLDTGRPLCVIGIPGFLYHTAATAAGISRRTIYAHFPSRGALLQAVTRHITAEVARGLAASTSTVAAPPTP